MNSLDEVILQNAQFKRDAPRPAKIAEAPALRMADRIERRPVSDNYRPLGAIVNQLLDRIHTIESAGNSGGAASLNELHFNNGTVKIDIDGNGIVVTKMSSGKVFAIAPAAITHDVSLATDSYCDAGATKTILYPRSAAY